MRFAWLAALLVAGCPADPVPDTDPDTDPGSDVDSDVDSDSDTEGDTDPDTSTCAYELWETWPVDCGGEVPDLLVYSLSVSADPGCPGVYNVGSVRGLDPAEVLAEAGCDAACVYQPFQAVMVLYCGSRGEYITYLPGGPGQSGDGASCPDLIEGMTLAGHGWYETWEQYQTAHPCPNNEPPVIGDVGDADVEFSIGGDPVVLAPDLTLADPDDADLLGATVAITSGYQQGVDVLVLTSRPVGISASWDESTGTMTLTGTTTVETWQNALRTVAFDGLNTGANGVRRVVTFTVQDRVQSSAPASRGVTMVAR